MKRKKVLIISYYWPPGGGITVLRCLKISKYLREQGWEPIVVVPDGAHYPTIDQSNQKDVLPDLEIHSVKIWEPYHIYKWITGKKKDANVNNVFYTNEEKTGWTHRFSVWIRSNFFIPDARMMWVKPVVKYLRNYLKDHHVDAIFSDGPPHTNTRIATLIKKEFGIPWLADFQDPWTQVDYYQLLSLTGWGDRKHRRMEQEVFRYADAISIVSPTWKHDLEQIGARNVSVIPWGYDPDDYPAAQTVNGKQFIITHTGIMGYDRNPVIMMEVLAAMCRHDSNFKQCLQLNLVGQVDHSVRSVIEDNGLTENVNYTGMVSREKALELTMSSTILLLLLNQQDNALGRIPGKLFEYLASRRPIISLGPVAGDASSIVNECKAGFASEYTDRETIQSIIENCWTAFQKGELQHPVDSQIDEYSVRNISLSVANILNKISK